MKRLLVIPLILSLTGCAMFTKTKLVPQAYMPEPPEILMRKPKDLNVVKQEPATQAPATTADPQPPENK